MRLAQENATVVGPVADQQFLAELYTAADALVMCSRCENYPTVCLEAISCGTPVAGFAVGGVGETICPGMGGTVPLGDMDAMKRLLLTLTAKKPEPERWESARVFYSKTRMAEEYLKLYRAMVENRE